MPLFLTQVNNWKSKRPEILKKGANGEHVNCVAYGDYFLLNTNRLVDIVETDDGTKFKYCQAPDDHRCSPDDVETGTTLAILRQWHDAAEVSKSGTFPIFPGWDTTEATVDTDIDFEDICMIYQTPRQFEDGVCTMVYYRNSFKRVKCLVDLNLIEVLALEYT